MGASIGYCILEKSSSRISAESVWWEGMERRGDAKKKE
jgi:hypothetical protein